MKETTKNRCGQETNFKFTEFWRCVNKPTEGGYYNDEEKICKWFFYKKLVKYFLISKNYAYLSNISSGHELFPSELEYLKSEGWELISHHEGWIWSSYYFKKVASL